MRRGDTCYIIVNNMSVMAATVLNINGNLYTLKLESGAGTCVPKHRIYETKEEADKYISAKRKKQQNPYNYM